MEKTMMIYMSTDNDSDLDIYLLQKTYDTTVCALLGGEGSLLNLFRMNTNTVNPTIRTAKPEIKRPRAIISFNSCSDKSEIGRK